MSQKTLERVLNRNGDLPAFKPWFLVTNLASHQTGYTDIATGFTRRAWLRITLAEAMDTTDFAPELFDESQQPLAIFHAPGVSGKQGAIQTTGF